MSSFIVEDRTINGIVAAIVSYKARPTHNTPLVSEPLANLTEDAPAFGLALRRLNEAAVGDRYGTDDIVETTIRILDIAGSDYSYQWVGVPTKVALYKSIRCFLYQCMEGDIPEHPLYKLIEEFAGSVAYSIVSGLPEFETAQWG